MALYLSCALPAGAWEVHGAPAESTNLGSNDYRNGKRNGRIINSYLVANDDGTLTRVEYTGEKVVVEEYSADFQFISGFSMDAELPLFGGFYSGETHNFLVFGQENDAEDDNTEVIRVVCYTKDWQRVGSDGLYGANTTIPFRAGSLRFAECDGYLYIRTCHQMYTSSDGLRHQANVMINFRIADTTITDSYWKVMNNAYGYVSHSFNQFVLVDGDDLLAVDHGDAYPRSVVLFKYVAPAGQDTFQAFKFVDMGEYWMTYYVDLVNVLHIDGQIGANDTGVALGGFEASDSAYLIAGNTVSQEPGCDLFGQRNIFISVTSKDDFSENGTVVRYLTNYAEGDDVDVSNPHFVKISGDRFAVLWTETADDASVLRYCFVDGQGNVQGQIYTTSGKLSDCKPVVVGNKLIWYITQYSAPTFLSIDLDNPENASHQHIYEYYYKVSPKINEDGSLGSRCVICNQASADVVIPARENVDAYVQSGWNREPTCTAGGSGYYTWKDAEKYHVDNVLYVMSVPALGHDWSAEGCDVSKTCARCGEYRQAGHRYESVVTAPTCVDGGYTTHTCIDCGDRYLDSETPARGHVLYYWETTIQMTCTNDGLLSHICFYCDYRETEVVPSTGHAYNSEVIVKNTCTEAGLVVKSCHRCGEEELIETAPRGHRYRGVVTLPTITESGYTTYTCTYCGDSYVGDEVPALGYTLTGMVKSCMTDGEVTVELMRNGQVIDSQILSGESCEYSFQLPQTGEYTLRISKIGHISAEVAVTVRDQQTRMDVELYPVGDITGDGDVNIKDFQRLLRHINKTNLLSEEMLVYGDVTGDGVVNIKDFQRLLRHINKTNPLF